MKINIVKQLDNSFKVAYDSDYEKLRKIKAGQIYEVEIKNQRNAKFHRKFFALINLVYQNQEFYNNIDRLRKDLIIASGHYTERVNYWGEIITEPHSIKFAKMSEEEFKKLYNDVLDTIVKHFNFDKQDIIDNVNRYF